VVDRVPRWKLSTATAIRQTARIATSTFILPSRLFKLESQPLGSKRALKWAKLAVRNALRPEIFRGCLFADGKQKARPTTAKTALLDRQKRSHSVGLQKTVKHEQDVSDLCRTTPRAKCLHQPARGCVRSYLAF
jgi:hypothetical protein